MYVYLKKHCIFARRWAVERILMAWFRFFFVCIAEPFVPRRAWPGGFKNEEGVSISCCQVYFYVKIVNSGDKNERWTTCEDIKVVGITLVERHPFGHHVRFLPNRPPGGLLRVFLVPSPAARSTPKDSYLSSADLWTSRSSLRVVEL